MNRFKTISLNLDIWLWQRRQRLREIRTEMKINPKFRRAFRSFFFIPIILTVTLFVVFPLLSDPWKDFKNQTESGTISSTQLANKMTGGFLQSRLNLAKSDSLYLIVNLQDSLALICIRGVPVRECPITRIRFSRAFHHGFQSGAIASWLEEPFTGQKTWSTIPKSILHVKTAPRDTLEAQKNYREPRAPVEKTDVFLTMCFDKNLELDIAQNTRPGISGVVLGSLIRFQFHLSRFLADVKRARSRNFPRHSLWIRIEVSREDARGIYRALPKQPRLILGFPAPNDPEKSQASPTNPGKK